MTKPGLIKSLNEIMKKAIRAISLSLVLIMAFSLPGCKRKTADNEYTEITMVTVNTEATVVKEQTTIIESTEIPQTNETTEITESHVADPEVVQSIVEDNSLTTAQNAIYTYDILVSHYPSVRYLAIVSSDYHIATGELLFTAEAILKADVPGEEKLIVISNASWDAPSDDLSTMFQATALIELSEV